MHSTSTTSLISLFPRLLAFVHVGLIQRSHPSLQSHGWRAIRPDRRERLLHGEGCCRPHQASPRCCGLYAQRGRGPSGSQAREPALSVSG